MEHERSRGRLHRRHHGPGEKLAAGLRFAATDVWGDIVGWFFIGLFFAGVYVAAGLFLYFALFNRGEVAWLVPAAAGGAPKT